MQEGWYTAREYLDHYCNIHVFGIKNQAIVFSALIVSAAVSFSAVQTTFSSKGAGASSVDWKNPSTLFSLLNMMVLGMLLFLCLVALERINVETDKLLKRLDLVGLEVSRVTNVEASVEERAKLDAAKNQEEVEVEKKALAFKRLKEKLAKQDEAVRAQAEATATSAENKQLVQMCSRLMSDMQEVADGIGVIDAVVLDLHKLTMKIQAHHEVNAEYQYLQNILSELRDQADQKKIMGVVIDRPVLARIFGGVVAVMYLIVKETADAILAKYSFASAMLRGQQEEEVDQGASGAELCGLSSERLEGIVGNFVDGLFMSLNTTCPMMLNVSAGGGVSVMAIDDGQ